MRVALVSGLLALVACEDATTHGASDAAAGSDAAIGDDLSAVDAAGQLTDGDDAGSDALAAPPPWPGAWPDRALKMAVTPIYEPVTDADAVHQLEAMRAELGAGGPSAALGFSASTFYCGELLKDAQTGQWHHDPARLRALLDLSQAMGMPVVVHLNGGHWCGGGLHDPTSPFNQEQDVWRADQIAWAWPVGAAAAAPYQPAPSSTGFDVYYASYSRLFDERNPASYRYWKRQILMEAVGEIVRYYQQPGKRPLLAGVSLDSETRYSDAPLAMDYNPTFVAEWRQYLRATGIYGPGGAYAGQGRSPALALADFNQAFSTSYASWAEVAPPPPPSGTPGALWHEWTRFRVEAVHHFTEDMRGWVVAAGLPPELVYNHQVPGVAFFFPADDLATAALGGAGTGITAYGTNAVDPNLFARVRGYGAGWGIFEHNPQDCGDPTLDQQRDQAALVALRTAGADILCPYAWPVDTNFQPCALYGGIAIHGTPYARALAQLLADPTPRPPRIDPRAPGTMRYRFFDHFAAAQAANSPDTHLAPAVAVGAVATDGIFQHPPPPGGWATLTFPQVAFPAAGGRLLFGATLGLVDTAAFGGDGVIARLRIGGASVLEVAVGVEDTWWHRWRPVLIDVTAFAGQTVDVALEVNASANSNWDHFVWGDPRLWSAP